MEKINNVLIFAGSFIMIGNIVGYIVFMFKMRDVISSGRKRDNHILTLGLSLLVFFFAGYLFVGLLSKADLMTALIILLGSIFVSVMLILTSHLIETAKERSVEITELLIGVIDARDPNLNGHSRHVMELTMLFYHYLPNHLRHNVNPVSLKYAALMHDIGKLGVAESILNKQDDLTDEEWKLMKSHPQIGVDLIKPLKFFDSISEWILYHHERIDGKGYYGIESENIPFASKILAITDTYSALTMRRSYKAPRTHEDAAEILKRVSGTQLDSELVEIFLSIPKKELESCIPEKIRY